MLWLNQSCSKLAIMKSGISQIQVKSNCICVAQKYRLQIVSLGFLKQYSCETLCPLTLKLDEEKLKIP